MSNIYKGRAYTPKRQSSRTCALPGCTNIIPNAWEDGRQKCCCRAHGQRLRYMTESSTKKHRAVDGLVEIVRNLRNAGCKVDGHIVFAQLLKLSDRDNFPYYDPLYGGFSGPEEIDKVLPTLNI